MATATKETATGVVLTVDGLWRCDVCSRSTTTTPVCSGAHDDGSPRCSRAVCERDALRCIRCKAPLCPDCAARSKEGSLCVQCPPPAGGRQAYMARQHARAATAAAGLPSGDDADWRTDSDRAYRAAASAQQSVDEAMRRAEDIERQINEMKARMRKTQTP